VAVYLWGPDVFGAYGPTFEGTGRLFLERKVASPMYWDRLRTRGTP
jgi:hypothetical protein